MKPAIVVVYSLTGHTRRVGGEIAQRLGCPMVEIAEPRPRSGVMAYLRSCFEAVTGRLPQIDRIDRDLRDFPLFVVGTPVWVGHVSSPVRSFLSRHRSEIGTLAAFCTMGGRDPAKTFGDIASISGKPLIATLATPQAELGSPQHAAGLDRFVAALREGG